MQILLYRAVWKPKTPYVNVEMHCSNEYVWHGWNRIQISLSNNTSLWPKDNLKHNHAAKLFCMPHQDYTSCDCNWNSLERRWERERGRRRKRERERQREGSRETEILDCGQMIRCFHEECAANRVLSWIKTRISCLMNSCAQCFFKFNCSFMVRISQHRKQHTCHCMCTCAHLHVD